MNIFSKQYGAKVDDRIHLQTFINQKGETEVYPLNSFPFEITMTWEGEHAALVTSRTATPNTTLLCIPVKLISRIINMLSMSKCGISSGFYFYEQTILKNNKYVYLYLGLNASNNTRCSIIADVALNSLNSICDNQPAAKWSEREIQDMFNIKFKNLADSRRLLLDYKTPKGVMGLRSVKLTQPAYSSFYDIYYV